MKKLKTKLRTILMMMTLLISFINNVYSVVTLQPATLPTAYCQYYYYQSMSVTGSSHIFHYRSTTLPANLTLDSITGILSGSVNRRVNSTATFTITARSITTTTLTAVRSYTLTIMNKKFTRQELINVWKQPYPQYADVYSTWYNSLDTSSATAPPNYCQDDKTDITCDTIILLAQNFLDIQLLKNDHQMGIRSDASQIDFYYYHDPLDDNRRSARLRFGPSQGTLDVSDLYGTNPEAKIRVNTATRSNSIFIDSISAYINIPSYADGLVLTAVSSGGTGYSEWKPISLASATVTTQSPGTNNTTIASTAFVAAAAVVATSNAVSTSAAAITAAAGKIPNIVITTAAATTLTNKTINLLAPVGVQGTYQLTFPSSPANGDFVVVTFDQVMTVVTYIAGTGGATINGQITGISAGGINQRRWDYDSVTNTWY